MTIRVTINGEVRELDEGTTIERIAIELSAAPAGRGLAVALEDEVVPRGRWSTTVPRDGARIEMLVAVGGG